MVTRLCLLLLLLLALAGQTVSFSITTHQKQYATSLQSAPSTAFELVQGTTPWNLCQGEADRAFLLGMLLEKNGQARKSATAFHEATTLYQCYLDSSKEFDHVTSLESLDCIRSILAYACFRLACLNHDALGSPTTAVRLFTEATSLDPTPSSLSFAGLGESLQAAFGSSKLEQAVEAYERAIQLAPNNRRIWFHLAVALDRLGGFDERVNDLFEKLRRSESVYACLVDSWGYIRWHTRNAKELNLYKGTKCMLTIALHAAAPLIEQGGLVCEYGVGSGRSIRMSQEILPIDTAIHGFDTFTGLPQAWGTEPVGSYSTGGVVPNLEGKVYFHKGLFIDTIVPFLKEQGDDAFLAFCNVDCRLYSSTLDILEAFHGRVVVGTVFCLNEYLGYPTWRQDEFRAWRECCTRFGWKYEYLAFSLSTKQVVVRIIGA
jgi:tetratricopeptide (TPR) repeat protein